MRKLLLTFSFFCISILIANAQSGRSMKTAASGGSGKRTALVIGNAAYRSAAPLKNPLNDANAMSTALRDLGFEVVKHLNTDRQSMEQAINDWGKTLDGNDVALFFYAGHGAEVNGINYLFPTDANPQNASQAKFQACPVELVIGWMDEAKVKTNILLLDACRDNPFTRSWSRSNAGGGLGNMNAPSGTFIGFATQPGKTAADGDRTNGVYTEAILKAIKVPDLTIDQVFNQVNSYVRQASSGVQVPFKNSSLEADFYFMVNTVERVSKTEPYTPPKQEEPARVELTKPLVDLEPIGMRYIEGGSFNMGSNFEDDEKPIHRVTVSSFRMATYETTVAEFERFVEETGYETYAERIIINRSYVCVNGKFENKKGVNWRHNTAGDLRPRSEYNHPVIHIGCDDAVAYCGWLTRKTGKTYRLPTEAEWEFAARGGNQSRGTTYAGSNRLEEVGWYAINTESKGTKSVGQKQANELGLYDMSGNVWEWCSDWYGETYYANSNSNNPTGPFKGSSHVLRGGGCYDSMQYNRVGNRIHYSEDWCINFVGFRVVTSE